MATLSATQPGNINDPLTWGNITPTSVDILDSNGYIININNNSLYSKLKNTFGGYFLLSDGINLSADIENTQTAPVSVLSVPSYCVLYEGVTFASITGKIKGGGLLDRYGLYINNNGRFTINGSPAGGYTLSTQGGGIAVKTGIFARNELIINGNLGTEGTFANPVTGRREFACVNSDALSSIIVNGNINIPNNASTVTGIQGIVVKNTINSPINPNITINGNIIINDYHGYNLIMDHNISGINYSICGIRYDCSTTALPGSINVNGNISVDNNNWYYGIYSTGKTNVTIKGDIIGGFTGNVPLRISNNSNSTILLSCASGFTGNVTGNDNTYSPVQIRACNNMTINVIGNIKNQFLKLGIANNPAESINNSILNIEGNIGSPTERGGKECVRTEDYCLNLTINIVGNINAGSNITEPIHLRAVNRTNNLRLNVFATEVIGGNSSSAIVTDAYDTNIFFDINAEEIAAHPFGSGHAINAIGRYLGSVKINAKRILDNFAGTTALYMRSYDLSDVPNDAIIRYASAPFLGFGPYVIHSTINSLSTFQMPPPEAVREGVVYAGGSLTGACRIPSVSSILLGTPVGAPDGNIGIATLDESLLNYDAIYNAPLTAFNYSNSVGERLRRGPTTEIVGEIIESFYPVH